MKLKPYYDSLPPGGRRALAETLGVAPTYLYQMVTGRRPVRPDLCRVIEKTTAGAVSAVEIRPDIFGRPLSAADAASEAA